MKNLFTLALCACLTISCLHSSAQSAANESKPKLFSAIANSFTVDVNQMAELLNKEAGTTVNLALGTAMQFQGTIVSTSNEYDGGLSSIVIRSTNYPGARLTFTRSISNGLTVYSGRILSMQHADIFELKSQNGQYLFTKKNLEDLVNE